MKIGHPAVPAAPTAVATERAAPAESGAPIRVTVPQGATGTVEPSTQVALSSTASTLRSGATSSASGDFDAEKVAKISAAIESGTFKVNPEAIADKLISNAQELLSKVSSR